MITADLKCNQLLLITFSQSNCDYFRLQSNTSNIFLINVNIIYHKQEMCACQQYLSLLIIKHYETYLVLVIDICYIVNLIHYNIYCIKWSDGV